MFVWIRCNLKTINRVVVDASTSVVLRIEGLQAFSSPGTHESATKSCRSNQPTLGLGWHGAELRT